MGRQVKYILGIVLMSVVGMMSHAATYTFSLLSSSAPTSGYSEVGLTVHSAGMSFSSSDGLSFGRNADSLAFDIVSSSEFITSVTVDAKQGSDKCDDGETHLKYNFGDGEGDESLDGYNDSYLSFTFTPSTSSRHFRISRGCGTGTKIKNLVITTHTGVSISGTNLNQNITLTDAITNMVITAGESCNFAATGLPSGVSLSAASGTSTTIGGTPTAAGTYNFTLTATSTSDGTKTGTVTGRIVVTSGPILSLTNGTQSGTVGSSLAQTITATSNKSTTTWVASGLPSGMNLSAASGTSVTVTGSPTQSGVFAYTISGTYGGETNVLNGTLTIAPKSPVLSISNDDQTVQQGSAITNMVVTSDSLVAWSIDCLPPGLIAIASPDSTTFTITGTPTEAETYNFMVTGRSVRHNKSTNLSGTLTVTEELVVCNVPTIGTQPVSISDDAGEEMSLTTAASDDGDTGVLTYQWYSNATESDNGGTLLVGETGTTLSVTPSTPGVVYYYCVVTNTCGVSTRRKDTTNVVSMTANCVDRSITVTSDDYAINTDENANLSIAYTPIAATGGDVTWTVSPATGSVSDGVFSASAGGTYEVRAAVAADGIYCAVSNTKMATDIVVTSNSCDAPTISVQPVAQNVNKGSSATLSVTATGSGTLSYQWYSNTSSTTSGATVIVGADESSYTVPTSSEGTIYYYCVVSNYCSAIDKTTSLTSDIVAMTVHCVSRTVNLTVTPLSITVDGSSTVSASLSAGTGDISIVVNNANGSVAAGEFSATAAGSYIITASVGASGNYCAANSNRTVTVTAPSAPVIYVSPSGSLEQDLLLGESMTTLTISANESVTYTTTGTITGVTVTDNGDNTLTISGTPTVENEDQTITITARNAGGIESSASVVLNVSAASTPLSCGALHCKNFVVPSAETYSLNLYNGGGSLVKTIYSAAMTSGNVQIIFQTNELANGTYTYKFETASTVVDSGTIVVNNE